MKKMKNIAVVGVGMHKFGRFPNTSTDELAHIAVFRALKDAGMGPKDIPIAYVGNWGENVYTGYDDVVGQHVLKGVGIDQIPITNIENACSSGSSAFREAWIAVGSGLYDVALALGVESQTRQGAQGLTSRGRTYDGQVGLQAPGWWSMRARKYMEKYALSIEQLAKVSVKNHANGCLDPYAMFQKKYTMEEVLKSPMIAWPLTLFQCCPITDGAAAAILCSEDVARRYTTKPVYVGHCALATATYSPQPDMLTIHGEVNASKEAYEMSGLGPEDLSFAEVHDCFSIAEVFRCENLGLCKRGEYPRLLDEGHWELGGDFPINPSGGLLSKGHPLGATGVAQVCEAVWHLRGEADARQVPGAKAALTHCSGGIIEPGLNATSTVIILHK